MKKLKERRFEKLLKAAENGNKKAMEKIIICYGEGIGTEQNFSEQTKWMRKAGYRIDYAPPKEHKTHEEYIEETEKEKIVSPSREDIQKAVKEARLETGRKYEGLTEKQFARQMKKDEKAMTRWEKKNKIKFKTDE